MIEDLKPLNPDGISKNEFKSHRHDFEDGQQLRDFVYVKDLLKVISWMLKSMTERTWKASTNGFYNVGTAQARSFYDLVTATFKGMDREPTITFIDMPEDISDKYQYFTQANVKKLRSAGYNAQFYTPEEGVDDYIRNYLLKGDIY